MSATKEVEVGKTFMPQFDAHGLIPTIAQDVESGQILMVAFMNDEALARSITTGRAVYYSRSRRKLWAKGEESGHVQKIIEILVDCDQDCLILKVRVDAGQCHVGYQSCFYRRVKAGGSEQLEFVAEPVYDPKDVYNK